MVSYPVTLSDPQGHDIFKRQISRKGYKIELYLQFSRPIKVVHDLSNGDLGFKDTPLFDLECLTNDTTVT